ncbi:MAG: type II secretion system protein [Bacteroidetes bacterium]|nr:type II secretion system protein [Bacteroidota bacterium]
MKKDTQKGFTLIETLVAIAIFALSITALISITARGIFDTNFAKNKLTASYLAIEGAELIRNVRDISALDNISWSTVLVQEDFLGNCYEGVDSDNKCYVDGSATDSVPNLLLCEGDCPSLNYNRDTAKFNYEFADNVNNFTSIFSRTIKIVKVDENEVRVTSRVDWLQGTRPHNIEYSFDLMPWANQ